MSIHAYKGCFTMMGPITVLLGLSVVLSGCLPQGTQHPDIQCTEGTACYSEDYRESGGTSGAGFAPPVAESELRVAASGVSAVIATNPFAIRFLDQKGQTVLQSVDADVPNYDPQCSLIEPDIRGEFSTSPLYANQQCQRYHALYFEAGEPESIEQLDHLYIEPVHFYRERTHYFATYVMAVTELDSGISLELATTRDNTTITLRVEADPSGAEALRVQAKVNDPTAQAVNFAFMSHFHEAFYGFGSRRDTLNQRGRSLYSWTLDGMGQWVTRPDLNYHRAYAPQNLFLSSNRYGVLVENTEMTRFYMGSDREDAWKMQVASNDMAFVVAPGEYSQSIESLTAINGRHRSLPEWAKGFIFSHRIPVRLFDPGKTGAYYRKAMDNLEQLDALGIETSAYLLEAWDAPHRMSLEEAEKVVEEIKSRGIKPMLYIREMLSKDTLRLEDPAYMDEAIENGYVPKRADGSPYVFRHNAAPTTYVDYSNPAANVWWEARVRRLLDFGGEGFMLDFGENIQPDMVFYNGKTGRSMHNLNPVLAAKETAAVIDKYERENPGREIMFFTRASFTGRPGSAAYEHAQFLGDNWQTWDSVTGLPAVIPDVLNRGLGGSHNLTTDIAGYIDWAGKSADKELFIRWTQLATFIPVFRLHNSPLKELIRPWDFDEETLEHFKDAIALRKKALPYMNSLWEEAAATGMPLWRPMWLVFPDDTRFRDNKDQFMLGDDVLVAPVTAPGALNKSVVLPEGCWTEMNSGITYDGNQTVEVAAPLLVLPYFFRCGTAPF
ncbi:MAG: glycoside hydrolase family 31 protein [Ketobacteraceae bacterium]|nr:glycoside hydrolase family 31 protein [Ketobacteraceae bacterium]